MRRLSTTARARSARTVLSAHPWGLGLIESRRSPEHGLAMVLDALALEVRRRS